MKENSWKPRGMALENKINVGDFFKGVGYGEGQ